MPDEQGDEPTNDGPGAADDGNVDIDPDCDASCERLVGCLHVAGDCEILDDVLGRCRAACWLTSDEADCPERVAAASEALGPLCASPSTDPSCDGVDDDGDGALDEDFRSENTCETGLGACRQEGQEVCRSGAVHCDALPGEPVDETCNGVDDDCDGTVDEDNPGQIIIHDPRSATFEFSPICNMSFYRFPYMYSAVDCGVFADGCAFVTEGPETVIWTVDPSSTYFPEALCCRIAGPACFSEAFECPVEDEVYPCSCTLETAEPVYIESCDVVEITLCR